MWASFSSWRPTASESESDAGVVGIHLYGDVDRVDKDVNGAVRIINLAHHAGAARRSPWPPRSAASWSRGRTEEIKCAGGNVPGGTLRPTPIVAPVHVQGTTPHRAPGRERNTLRTNVVSGYDFEVEYQYAGRAKEDVDERAG